MRSWKAKEKQFVEWLNEEALPWVAERMSRAFRGEGIEDIKYGPFSLELKTGSNVVPGHMEDWLSQALENCGGRIPIVIVHRDRMKRGDQVVMLRYRDWIRLLYEMLEERK